MNDKLLTIAIPTYNRDYMLDEMLKHLCPICKELDIDIVISDNASPDNTQNVIEKYSARFYIKNFRQEENIGPDKNFEFLLQNCKTEYIYLLSDCGLIEKNQLQGLLTELQDNLYDFVVVGAVSRTDYLPIYKIYDNRNELLDEIGWHMTALSSLIYNKNVVKELNFERYYETNFLQTGIIFEYLAYKHDFKCLFYNKLKFSGVNLPKRDHWMNEAFEYFCKRWYLFIMSLPQAYKYEVKRKCLMEHGIRSNLFSKKQLYKFRMDKVLTFKVLQKYNEFTHSTIKYYKTVLLFCCIPAFVFKTIFILLKLVKRYYHEKK